MPGIMSGEPSSRTQDFRFWSLDLKFLLVFLLLVLARTSKGAVSSASSSGPFPVTEVNLTNGLQVLTLEDHNCPLVAVQVWYHVGSADEPDGRHGFAHLFEHMMFRGTDRLGPTDHFDLIHSVGGDCNAYTAFDETCYHETLPAEQLELAFWLECERMAFLTVDGPGFTTERKVVEEERRSQAKQAWWVARRRSGEALANSTRVSNA
jgi:predicted Zn-dependent peptidase